MPPQAVFGISVAFSFVVWGIVTYHYVWPALRSKLRANALRPILLLHSFRFVGLAFLVPGVVSPELPMAFAGPAAYGDLATAILAVLAFATLWSPLGLILVGRSTFSALPICSKGNRTGLGLAPGLQGAAYFIPTVLVPLLLITHGLVFRLLLKGRTPGDHGAST